MFERFQGEASWRSGDAEDCKSSNAPDFITISLEKQPEQGLNIRSVWKTARVRKGVKS